LDLISGGLSNQGKKLNLTIFPQDSAEQRLIASFVFPQPVQKAVEDAVQNLRISSNRNKRRML
jgi:hypothetical protein